MGAASERVIYSRVVMSQKRELEDRLRRLRADAAPNLVKEPSRRHTPRFGQSFAIRLSRTKHGRDEANDRIG